LIFVFIFGGAPRSYRLCFRLIGKSAIAFPDLRRIDRLFAYFAAWTTIAAAASLYCPGF